ncbi:MAG: thioesterase [Thermoleophilia bacterium]|nr:thioesterase [Thermoleophilia bacterium]
MEPLVPQPSSGRIFRTSTRIRLSDMDATGRLRLDAVARYLQDAATDDVEETGWGAPEHLWVLRSIRIDVVASCLDDRLVEIATWGSGFSGLAAGRRWSLVGDRGGAIEVDSVWIHLGPDARPARIGAGFDAYAEAAGGRSVSTRLTLPDPPEDAPRIPWHLRVTDLDVLGHVNNAVYWSAVEHCLQRRELDVRLPVRARLDYRHPIDLDEDVELAEDVNQDRYRLAFVSGGVVKAVACVEQLV